VAFYVVNIRERVIQRVTRSSNEVDNQRFFLIEAASPKQAWAKANGSSAAFGRADCEGCRHRHCRVCEQCSVAKQNSDYWICHRCGELNLRAPKLNLREVSHGLGKN
jgi:hypothetical protein